MKDGINANKIKKINKNHYDKNMANNYWDIIGTKRRDGKSWIFHIKVKVNLAGHTVVPSSCQPDDKSDFMDKNTENKWKITR